MQKTAILLVISLIILLTIVYIHFSTVNNGSSNSVNNTGTLTTFYGVITNRQAGNGTFSEKGIGIQYDKFCVLDNKTGLTNCHAGLLTKGTILDFDYEHNMTVKPCLSPGDIVNVFIYSNNSAIVTRTYMASGSGSD
jgi:hypothetical protein